MLSDKPATVSLNECKQLRDQLKSTGLLYGLTHPYTSYPMVTEAKERVAQGQLGKVRKVLVEYTQGWLADAIEHGDNAQARWRMDPDRAGPSCCMGDIGVHAFNLAEYVAGIEVTELAADLNRTVDGRVLDDDGTALLRFADGAHGVLIASQICIGEENNLEIRVYGDAGSLKWNQQEPNSLWLKYSDKPIELLRSASGYLGAQALVEHARLPPGHPEGYIEAFANIYRNFAEQVRAHAEGTVPPEVMVPGIDDALRGMAFIEIAVAASASEAKWHRFPNLD